MTFETLTLKSIRARPVVLKLARPVVARIATIADWPLILIDLHTEEGVTGRSYLEPYIIKSMRYLIPALHDLGVMLKGRRVVVGRRWPQTSTPSAGSSRRRDRRHARPGDPPRLGSSALRSRVNRRGEYRIRGSRHRDAPPRWSSFERVTCKRFAAPASQARACGSVPSVARRNWSAAGEGQVAQGRLPVPRCRELVALQELSANETGARKVGAVEDGSEEICAFEIGAGQLRIAQIRAAQIRPAKVGLGKLGAHEVEAMQMAIGKRRVLARVRCAPSVPFGHPALQKRLMCLVGHGFPPPKNPPQADEFQAP